MRLPAVRLTQKSGTGASAPFSYAALYFYDPTAHTLKSVYCSSDGLTMPSDCTFEGDSLKFTWTQEEKGQKYQCRQIWTVAPDRKTSKYEWNYSEDGVTWKPVCKGTAKRVADAAKTPGPGHKKLEMYTGKWKSESVDFESPWGSAAKSSGSFEGRMILGGFFMESKGHNIGADGAWDSLEIMAYDSEQSHYQDAWFDSGGDFDRPWKGEPATAIIQGNSWNWSWNEEKAGKNYYCRQVDTFAPDLKSMTWEVLYSENGSDWIKRGEGRATKAGENNAN